MNHWIFAGLKKNKNKKSKSTIVSCADETKAKEIVEICRIVFEFKGRFKNNRLRECVDTKKAIVHFIIKYTRLTLNQICEYVGLTDHSSIIHLRKHCNDLIRLDLVFRMKIKEIEKLILEL